MAVIECPLCCAEVFSDICALANHLLDLCENILCPICDVQFSTIQSLASHLGKGCESDKKSNDILTDLRDFDNKKVDVNSQYSDVCLSYSGTIDGNVSINNEITSSSLLPNDSNNLLSNAPKNEDINVPDSVNQINIEPTSEVSIQQEIVEKYPNALYSCSVCNITFTSVKDHLDEFHINENVIVDNVSNVSILKEAESNTVQQNEISLSEVELLPKTTGSVLLTAEDVDSLLIVNWDPNSCFNEKQNIILYNSNENNDLSDENDQETHHWISCDGFYYYSKDPNKTDIDTLKKNSLNLKCSDEWPSKLLKYPIATYVSIRDSTSLNNDSCENKTYILNNHRVRLLSMKGKDGTPCLEDIPFLEEPPPSLVPLLERNIVAPSDLIGTYSVMWPCLLCGALVYHWFDLAKHNCSSTSKYFPCTMCKETFQSRRHLNNHYSVFHKVTRSATAYIPCPMCPAKLRTSTHLEKHMIMHKKNDLVRCDICESMVQKFTYSEHRKAHEKNGSLSSVCLNCNRSFKGETELNLHTPLCHLMMDKKDNLKCVECGELFTDVSYVREHMTSHGIPIKQHLCSFCFKSYHRIIDKVMHERIHTKSKPHSCSECGRCFRLRDSLVAHMRIHTGEKPYKCTSCNKLFRTKLLLRSHVAVHGRYRQFKCKYCKTIFRSKAKLEHHENFHKEPFICNQCNRTFYSNIKAQKHSEDHKNNDLHFTCNICPNMFTRAAYLESHLRTQHGLDVVTSISISSHKTYQDMEMSAIDPV